MSPRPKMLFVTFMGFILDAAWRASKEGYPVKLATLKKEYRSLGTGLVPQAPDWERELDWADIVIFDDVLGFGDLANRCRKKGKRVIGGTPYTDRLEDDRDFGQAEMKRAGIQTLDSFKFSSFSAGADFIRRTPRAYVLKPCGEAANQKKLLFVGQESDGNDVTLALARYAESLGDTAWEYVLQPKVTGLEVSVCAFFDGLKFLAPISITFEHKRLFAGELGPQTGEMGTSMFWSEPNEFFRRTLQKMEPRLREEGYCGAIDINCIVNRDGIHPLEFTCRFGFPTIYIQQEGFAEPVGQWLTELACGNRSRFPVRPGFQIGVQVRVPPFPYRDPYAFERLSKDLFICKEPDLDAGIHPQDIYAKDGNWYLAGDDGCPVAVCASGETMAEAQALAYARVKKLKIPNAFYRLDIGERWHAEGDVDRLLAWGLLT